MNLTRYAESQGISTKTAQRWFRAGTLPHPAQKVGRLILVDVPDEPASPTSPHPQRTALYLGGRSSSPHEIREWALEHGIRIDETHRDETVPSEASSTVLKELLADPSVTRIVTDFHPDADLLSAALSAQGREFITAQPYRQNAARTFTPRIASRTGA